jgi:hypothetical protein
MECMADGVNGSNRVTGSNRVNRSNRVGRPNRTGRVNLMQHHTTVCIQISKKMLVAFAAPALPYGCF